MDNNTSLSSPLFSSLSALREEKIEKEILSLNEKARQYGLILSEKGAKALAEAQKHALKSNGRIELENGIAAKMVDAFCSSPYLSQDSFESTVSELIEIFYQIKNDTNDTVSDDDIVSFMAHSFNTVCGGSLQMLAGQEASRLIKKVNESLGGGTL